MSNTLDNFFQLTTASEVADTLALFTENYIHKNDVPAKDAAEKAYLSLQLTKLIFTLEKQHGSNSIELTTR